MAKKHYETINKEQLLGNFKSIRIMDRNYRNLSNIYHYIKNDDKFLIRIAVSVYEKENQSMKSNNERIEILTNKTIRDKLLAYFKNNTKNSNNRIVYLPFTLTDLADYLAVNRSAMSRELKTLKDEGFIEIKNKKIKLES